MKQIWLITWIMVLPILNNMNSEISLESKNLHPGRVKDILVLSVAGNEDSRAALCIEKELANELKKINYAAESAIEHFGRNAFSKIREEETIKQLYPYDAVIIIALVKEDQEKDAKASECNDFFWEYYDNRYSVAHDPHARKSGKYSWEASFFEISSWKLQYRMKTSSFPYSQAGKMIPAYSKLISEDMLKKQIIRPIPGKLKAF